MTPEQRAELARLLQAGAEISPEWARIIFPPEKREYELVYQGKEREEDVLADTIIVPLQPVRTFGANGSVPEWQNMLIFGDNLQSMRTLLELKKSGKLCNADGTPGVRLVYIDPPFATKREFSGSQDQKAYQDKIAGARFIEFLRKRLLLIRELLSDDGSLYVHLDTKKSHYMKAVLDELFGESNFRNEIIWRRQSAHNDSNQCGAIHDTILFYTRGPRRIWNEILVQPSPDYIEEFFDQVEPRTDRKYARGDLTAGGLSGGGYDYVYKGIRRIWRCPKTTMENYARENRLHWPKEGVPRLKRYLDEFEGVPVQDIWADIRVIHNRSAERVGYPTQKPEALIERVVRLSSNKGDVVLDAFVGAGTTCAVAEKLDRRWVGIDCGKLAIYTIQKRLLNLHRDIGEKGPVLKAKPFTLYNAGLYDFSKLRDLPWESWRFFALQLFQCRDEPHRINGVQFDGYLKGSSVLVFRHRSQNGDRLTVDEATIESIHSAVGRRVNRRLFIIAPAMSFDFQQDYLEVDGIRYYALRIPYSIIHELHQREFTALRQPADERAVNDTVEAVGFDFIRPPTVEFKAETAGSEGILRLTKFLSQSTVTDSAADPFAAFSMLLIDYDYDTKSQIFDLNAVVYADALRATDWEHRFPANVVGESVMVVCMDIFGNEARVLVDGTTYRSTSPRPRRRGAKPRKRQTVARVRHQRLKATGR